MQTFKMSRNRINTGFIALLVLIATMRETLVLRIEQAFTERTFEQTT